MNTLTLVKIFQLIFMTVICVGIFKIAKQVLDNSSEFVTLSQKAVDTAIGKAETGYFNKNRIEAFLSQTGVMYRRDDYTLSASTYIMEKIFVGCICLIIAMIVAPGIILKLGIGVFGFLTGFMIPDVLANMKNKKDNAQMQDDIISIYNILKLHSKAGVYMSDSLIECQRTITNPRLKTGLTELNNNILSRRITLEESVDVFNARFKNDQIDNLSVILKQSLRTGHTADMLSDITKQIEDINNLRAEEEELKIKRQSRMMNVAFFVGISVLALYMVGVQLVDSMSDIF